MVVTVGCEDERDEDPLIPGTFAVRDDTNTDDDAEDIVSGVVANKRVHWMIGGLDRNWRLWGGR